MEKVTFFKREYTFFNAEDVAKAKDMYDSTDFSNRVDFEFALELNNIAFVFGNVIVTE